MSKTISLSGFEFSGVENLKEFVKGFTNEDAIYALRVWLPNNRFPEVRAQVQFTGLEDAENFLAIINNLSYLDSQLKARYESDDIVTDSRAFINTLNCAKLRFGCMVAKDKFGRFWTHKNVRVQHDEDSGKFYFFLMSDEAVTHKLELSHENIWEMKMFSPREQNVKYLVIQLLGAPKIYRKDPSPYRFCRDATDDEWVREVDFTPSLSIGQSSSLCLELSKCSHIPLFNCFENVVPFNLRKKLTFSSNPVLVPIIESSQFPDLPYEILFQVNSLIHHGCIPGVSVDEKFFRLVNPSPSLPLGLIQHTLQKIFNLKECCYRPDKWIKNQYQTYMASHRMPESPFFPLNDGMVYVYRVRITPTKVIFCGPEVNLSNRVLRKYPEDLNNFLRVSFVDEDFDKLFSTVISPRISSTSQRRKTAIYQRILTILREGIQIGKKKFEFLGCSDSQLRESSLWMFASRPGLSAADIRQWMGDFSDIKVVAKYAARLGQSFSQSKSPCHVQSSEIEEIPDITISEYNFSDGIGKISSDFARAIGERMGFRNNVPSAFQIRYGGYKGVVAVDPYSSKKLSLRKSMSKFKSNATSLDILNSSKYMPCFLNREVITLLSTLGVRDHVFIKKQEQAVSHLDAALTDPGCAIEALELTARGPCTTLVTKMLEIGYKPNSEPLLSMILQTFRASKLIDLRTKAKIFIPKGRCMMGCLDEYGILNYGQVFIQYSRGKSKDEAEKTIVTEKVVVTKNPCLHPGDVRVLQAMDVPALHHMVDCIVFPQKGKRPHTNECSGSDLDGDLYFVSWDEDLVPPRMFDPQDYTSSSRKDLDHDVTIEEVQEFFVDYLLNNNLGVICSAHTVYADWDKKMAESRRCIELAELASKAVDFTKTGVPAEIPPRLRPSTYPDFMEKTDKKSYESRRVLGKLFRAITKIPSDIFPVSKDVIQRSYDPEMEVEGFQAFLHEAIERKKEYDNRLASLMNYYGINTEAEMISGCILKTKKSFDRRKDRDDIIMAIEALKKQVRIWFADVSRSSHGGTDDWPEKKASAWYCVTYHPYFWDQFDDGSGRDHFLSFPWCVYEELIKMKKRRASEVVLVNLSLY